MVLEIVAGIVVGPSVLGWVEVDEAVEVVALLGLAFVLFLAGLEIEFEKLRGPVLRLTLLGFALSFAIALVVSLGLRAAGLVDTPLLVAIILCATSLGVLVPVLKDSGEIASHVRAADHRRRVDRRLRRDHPALDLLLRRGRDRLDAAAARRAVRARRACCSSSSAAPSARCALRADLLRLQDTTAQIRVRAALVLLVGFAALAETLGLEVILGAFIAGAIVSLVDRDQVMTHPEFRRKLEAVGFGFFIPAFFVTSGVRFDLDALTASASNLLMVPIFLAALLAARGMPAIALPPRARRAARPRSPG